MTTQRCPHCGRELRRRGMGLHVKTCPLRPEIADAMRVAMTGVDGYAVPLETYEAQRSADLPTIQTVLASCGSWAKAVAHFGVPRREGGKRLCPHCGREYRGYGLTNHVTKCPRRPEIADALRAALTSAEDGCMVSYGEYDAVRPDRLPHPDVLLRTFGGWGEALATAFGLTMRTQDAVNRRRSDSYRRNRALGLTVRSSNSGAPEGDPLLLGAVRAREDYGEFDGLPVCAVRRDRSGGVAWMLR